MNEETKNPCDMQRGYLNVPTLPHEFLSGFTDAWRHELFNGNSRFIADATDHVTVEGPAAFSVTYGGELVPMKPGPFALALNAMGFDTSNINAEGIRLEGEMETNAFRDMADVKVEGSMSATVELSVVGRLLEVGTKWSDETRVVVEYVDGAGEIRTSDMYCSKEDAMRLAKHLYGKVKLTIEKIGSEKIAADDDKIEALAEYAHAAWAGWMRYMFGQSRENEDGSITIYPSSVKRWFRHMETPYKDLPESEKDSDRAEAVKILAIMRE